MKKFSFLPILALVLGIAASAFTVLPDKGEQNTDVYWFPTDDAGNVTSTQISTSETVEPCPQGGELFCALGYPEDSPYITVQGNTVTLNDTDPLMNGIPSKRDD